MYSGVNTYPFNIEFREKNGKPFFASFPFIFNGEKVKGVTCGISSRYAGDMKYDKTNENRTLLFRELKLNPSLVYGLEQKHTKSVLIADEKNPPSSIADGLITNDKKISLSVTVADCLPVYLFDTQKRITGIVHSGRKGTGIALNALNLMTEMYGTKAEDVAAIIGPCIDSCCYIVDEECALLFKNEFGGHGVQKRDGNYFIDMKTVNINLLSNAGVKNIAVCKDCTFCDERLGSFRREGGNYTRMAALVFFDSF